jgi:hypothetical protein
MRVNNWPRVLHEFVISRARTPFEWGKQDCCMFVADCVQALTGVDPAAAYRGTYTNEQEACAILDRLGGVEAIAEASGFKEVGLLYAQRGDVVSFQGPIEIALGICVGKWIYFPGETGLVQQPLSAGRRAWRVA